MDSPAVRAPDFPDTLEWIHSGGRRLSLKDFAGKLLLLDFWTYGCINCIHIIPQLRALEEKFGDSLAVVGVHSGKFAGERESSRILDASIRLNAIHPTLNDRQFRVWRAYAVDAWPTLVAVDPRGYVVGMRSGEFLAPDLFPFIERVLAESRGNGSLNARPQHFPADVPTVTPGILAFPGKIAIDGDRIAIADSGHNRVLVGTLTDCQPEGAADCQPEDSVGGHPESSEGSAFSHQARIHHIIGAGEFNNPQGLAFEGETLYVADTGNHRICAVSLNDGLVRTIAGTGQKARNANDIDAGAMRSPWDVALHGGMLYIAMAGSHQIWKVDPATGRLEVHCGSGAEELHDGSLSQAALAQPNSLCVVGAKLCFTDTESSAIRLADISSEGNVQTVVGTGLFDFGDVDAIADDVRLQHPQGIALGADGRILIADSYNHALKWIDIEERRATTFLPDLNEPCGVAIAGNYAFVAETNAHQVVVVDLATSQRSVLEIVVPS